MNKNELLSLEEVQNIQTKQELITLLKIKKHLFKKLNLH